MSIFWSMNLEQTLIYQKFFLWKSSIFHPFDAEAAERILKVIDIHILLQSPCVITLYNIYTVYIHHMTFHLNYHQKFAQRHASILTRWAGLISKVHLTFSKLSQFFKLCEERTMKLSLFILVIFPAIALSQQQGHQK